MLVRGTGRRHHGFWAATLEGSLKSEADLNAPRATVRDAPDVAKFAIGFGSSILIAEATGIDSVS